MYLNIFYALFYILLEFSPGSLIDIINRWINTLFIPLGKFKNIMYLFIIFCVVNVKLQSN